MTEFDLIDKAANRNEIMPKGLSLCEQIYFTGMRYLYLCATQNIIGIEQAKEEKQSLRQKVEVWSIRGKIFKQGVLIYNEMQKLIAPQSEFRHKSKEELLEIVCRILLLNQGLIEKSDERLPEHYVKLFGLGEGERKGKRVNE